MSNTPCCYIGLGSNLADPHAQLCHAILQLKQLPATTFIVASSFYQTKPVGPQDQPDFINAVVALETTLLAQALLIELQAIENKQGRVRHVHWGPRTLDLDILLYGSDVINTPTLVVPHPALLNRSFVVTPLLEIAPDLQLPNGDFIKNFRP